jgi:hypothetical protein
VGYPDVVSLYGRSLLEGQWWRHPKAPQGALTACTRMPGSYRISAQARDRMKGAGIMSLLPLRGWPARHLDEPAGWLPAPGSHPAPRPPRHAIVIVVVVLAAAVWLVAHGYSAATALGVIAGADALAAAIASRLARAQAGGD